MKEQSKELAKLSFELLQIDDKKQAYEKLGEMAEVIKKFRTHLRLFKVNMPDGYASWQNMVQRCTNPNNPRYASYGGSGISVHNPWVKDYKEFLSYIGPRPSPSPEYSVDRIDNTGNYEPGNVKWSNKVEQVNNQFKSVRFPRADGTLMSIREAMNTSGLSKATLSLRIKRLGMTIDDAMSIPSGGKIPASMKFKGSGKTKLYPLASAIQ